MARHVETAWLIENVGARRAQEPELWFTVLNGVRTWSENKDVAVRFARAQDALRVRSMLAMEDHLSVSEHQWVVS